MALTSMTSPPLLVKSSMKNRLGFAYVSLMKLVNLLHGVGEVFH